MPSCYPILRRIAQKQADFVGKFPALPEPADHLHQGLLAAARKVSLLPQKLSGQSVRQILGKPPGTVHIDQRFVGGGAKGQRPQPLGFQPPVELPHRLEQLPGAAAGTDKQAGGFDSRQGGGAVADQIIIGHGVPSRKRLFVVPEMVLEPGAQKQDADNTGNCAQRLQQFQRNHRPS